MMMKNSQWMIHSFHVLKIGLKNTTLRAQFFTLLFFSSTLPIVNSWLGTFFQKELSLHLAFSQIPFNIFGGLDLIEKTLKMTETLPDSTLRNLLW